MFEIWFGRVSLGYDTRVIFIEEFQGREGGCDDHQRRLNGGGEEDADVGGDEV